MRRQALCAVLFLAATTACNDADVPTSATPGDPAFAIVPSVFRFLEPVKNAPEVNLRVAGAATLVRFTLGEFFGMDIFPPGYPAMQEIDPMTFEPIGSKVPIEMTGGSKLHFDPGANAYGFVMDINPDWDKTTRRLRLGRGQDDRAEDRQRRIPTVNSRI